MNKKVFEYNEKNDYENDLSEDFVDDILSLMNIKEDLPPKKEKE